MLKQTSPGFRKIFLLAFTKRLIDAYAPEDIAKLERILKKEEKIKTDKSEPKELVKEIISKKEKEDKLRERKQKQRESNIDIESLNQDLKRNLENLRRMRPILRIPETKLPQTFQYLKPTPTNKEIDLGKLNVFIKDPQVRLIECYGPNEYVVVHGSMGAKPTKVVLNKEEIDAIIKNFAEKAKIPLDEGVFKAAFGRLIMSAIVSETVGSKFVIRKIPISPQPY